MTTIVSLLDRAVASNADRPALVARRGIGAERWSYASLGGYSLRVAAFLSRVAGVRPGDFIVVWAPNSPEWVGLYFGCLRVGAVLVPLDVRCSPDFAARIAQKVRPKLVVISRQLDQQSTALAGVDGAGCRSVYIEDLTARLAEVGGDGAAGPFGREGNLAGYVPSPSDIAELMFTSGTTGEPKGVILTHGNIVSNAEAASRAVPARPEYRLLSLLPLSHMLEQTVGLLAPLSGGACIVYPSSRQPAAIFKTIQEERITTIGVVPEILRLFWSAIEREVQKQGRDRAFVRLRKVARGLPMPVRRVIFRRLHGRLGGRLTFFMAGGAYLDPDLAAKWESIGVYVLQGYGTTEASPVVTTNTFRDRRLDSVGCVLPGQELRIAEDGEVLIRGRNVTPGYWRDPEATAAAFDGDWYRTGDLGFLDRDGRLHLQGRKKDMIVLENGMNVHAQDVENALKAHSDVVDAAVLGLPDRTGRTVVHAAVVLRKPAVDASEAVKTANAGLAEHQRVRGVTVWPFEDFPRTHTLKVRKRDVAAYITGNAPDSFGRSITDAHSITIGQSSTDRLAPTDGQSSMDRRGPDGRTATTKLPPSYAGVVEIVAAAARVDAYGVEPGRSLEDDLGLDSLKRVEVLAEIEARLNAYIDEGQVGPDTTVEELRELAAQAGPRDPSRVVDRIATWPLNPVVGFVRTIAQIGLSLVVRRALHIRVNGFESMADVAGPVIFAANHKSHMDTAAVLASLPVGIRRRIAVAAAADYWFEAGRLRRVFAGFAFNGFPFSRNTAVRQTLGHCTRLLDSGWSILIYPEGTRSTAAGMASFKSGTGLMAVELGVPVVPVRIAGTNHILPKGRWLPRRGSVTVSFGAPLRMAPGTSPTDATRRVQAAVKALADH